MTTTASPSTTGPGISPIPFDLYREVHKGLRRTLFDLTVQLGSTDHRDPVARTAAVDRVGAVIELLHHHHRHEDDHIQALLVRTDAALAAIVDDGHLEVEEQIAAIEVEAQQLRSASGGDAIRTGLSLYRRLALFTAHYLVHMALEEGGVMEALRQAVSVEDLFALEMDLRGSIAPPVMCDFITAMVPAMNRSERAEMLSGMRAGAPAEIFEVFRATAEAALDIDDYRMVASDIGIA